MRIQDIMDSTNQQLEAIEHNYSVKEAVQEMFKTNAHSLLVVDDNGALVGIVTERDIARALGEHGRNAALMQISQIMSLDLVICDPDENVQQALALMGKNKIRNLPVVAANGHMLGVVGIMELVQSIL